MTPLLRVEGLHKRFKTAGYTVYAVNGVDLEIEPGEAVALVGESGCGKSTTARCILRLVEPTAGRVVFKDLDLTRLPPPAMRRHRRHLQMVFQDPSLSLNPQLTVRQALAEPLELHGLARGRDAVEKRLRELMALVRLEPQHLDRRPAQLSGGQKQRVGIARAIASNPELVLLDEPTSSLDMSVRIHIVELLRELQHELGMTYLFISHDLSTVRYLCQRVLVMYLGRIIESGPVDLIFDRPAHMYTRALLSAIPIPDPDVRRRRIILPGETPSLTHLMTGCPLQDRCTAVEDRCRRDAQPLVDIGGGQRVACWRALDASGLVPSSRVPLPDPAGAA
jgi:oligopeptide/dipeptide ABC transporter ATP-binding protein